MFGLVVGLILRLEASSLLQSLMERSTSCLQIGRSFAGACNVRENVFVVLNAFVLLLRLSYSRQLTLTRAPDKLPTLLLMQVSVF